MHNDTHFLFVYGTLRKEFKHPLCRLLREHGKFCGEAFFRGVLYKMDHYPGAVPAPDSERNITGELYKLTEPSDVLPKLDRYEGYHPGFPGKSLFVREKKMVQLKEGTALRAWIYLYNRPVESFPVIESGDYLHFRSPE